MRKRFIKGSGRFFPKLGGFSTTGDKTILLLGLLASILLASTLYFTLKFNDYGVKKFDNSQVAAVAQSFADKCQKNFNWRDCYSNEFKSFTRNNDLKLSMVVLEEVQKIDNITRECHVIAHGISYGEISKNPPSWLNYLAKVDPNECMGGFIHGAVEAYSAFDANFELDKQSITDVCERNKLGKHFCYHAMGHLLMVEKLGSEQGSAEVCSTLTSSDSYACKSGVFMESLYKTNMKAHGLAEPSRFGEELARDQEVKCKKFIGESAVTCWQELVHLYNYLANNDPQKVYRLCSRSPLSGGRDQCYLHGVGLITSDSKYIEHSGLDSNKLCGVFVQGKSKELENCFAAIITPLLFSSSKYAASAVGFCESADGINRQRCYGVILRKVLQMSTKAKAEVCRELPQYYKSKCN